MFYLFDLSLSPSIYSSSLAHSLLRKLPLNIALAGILYAFSTLLFLSVRQSEFLRSLFFCLLCCIFILSLFKVPPPDFLLRCLLIVFFGRMKRLCLISGSLSVLFLPLCFCYSPSLIYWLSQCLDYIADGRYYATERSLTFTRFLPHCLYARLSLTFHIPLNHFM